MPYSIDIILNFKSHCYHLKFCLAFKFVNCTSMKLYSIKQETLTITACTIFGLLNKKVKLVRTTQPEHTRKYEQTIDTLPFQNTFLHHIHKQYFLFHMYFTKRCSAACLWLKKGSLDHMRSPLKIK